MYLWRGLAPETIEPYLQVASAAIIIAMGVWMIWRVRRDQALAAVAHHDHGHHDHGGGEGPRIDTGHGVLRLEIFENAAPPRFRLYPDHGHAHIQEELRGLDLTAGAQDAHELAHANDIRRRFADRDVTTGQIVIFGLTGGLIPRPGAITVLLLCLQLKAFTLGAVLVLCFSQ